MILLSLSIVSAADNDSVSVDNQISGNDVVSSDSDDINSQDDSSSIKYFNVRNNTEVNAIVNDSSIDADSIVISFDDNYQDDGFFNFNLSNASNLKFKNVIIDAYNKSVDMGFHFWYDDFLHSDNLDASYASIFIDDAYSLTFKNIRLSNICINNNGTLIFNNSVLESYRNSLTPISNNNLLVIDNSKIISSYDLIDNENGNLIVNSCEIIDGIDVFYNGNITLTDSIIKNSQFSDLSGYVKNNVFTDNSTVCTFGKITFEDNIFYNNNVSNLIESQGNAVFVNNIFKDNTLDNLIFLSSSRTWYEEKEYSTFNKDANSSLIKSNTFNDNLLKNSLIITDYPVNISDNVFKENNLVFNKSLIHISDNGPSLIEYDDYGYKLNYYPHNIINITSNNFTSNNAGMISSNNTNYTVNIIQNDFSHNNISGRIFNGLNLINKSNIFDSNNNRLLKSFINLKTSKAIAGDIIPLIIEINDENNNPCSGFVNIYFDNSSVEESYTENNITISSIGSYMTDYQTHDGKLIVYFKASNELNTYDNIVVKYSGMGNVLSSVYKTDNDIDVTLRNATLSLNTEKIYDDGEKLLFTVYINDTYNQTDHTHSDAADVEFIFDDRLTKESNIHTHVLDNNTATYKLDVSDRMKKLYYSGQLKDYSVKVIYTNDEYYNPVTLNATINLGTDNKKTDGVTKNNYKNTYSASIKSNKYPSNAKKQFNKIGNFKHNQKITLAMINNLFNHDFTNKHMLIYIGDTLVFNDTVSDDLSKILFNIASNLTGDYTIKIILNEDNNEIFTKLIHIN